MSEVHRFTSKYVSAEDRIKLLMELKSGEVQVLWLTRRLLNALVPFLLEKLEHATAATKVAATAPSDSKAKMVQRFSQQAALGTIQKQPAVQPSEETPQRHVAMLVTEVKVRADGATLTLDFRGGDTVLQSLPFGEEALRQWLDVIYRQYHAGGWQESFWPSWMAPITEAEAARHLN